MTYIQWRQELANHLVSLSKNEQEKVFAYYAEMYADKRDAGLTESQIILSFGAPYDVAKKILSENCDENGRTCTNLNDIQHNDINSKKADFDGKNNKNNKPSSSKKGARKVIFIILLIVVAIFGLAAIFVGVKVLFSFLFAPEFILKEYKTSNIDGVSKISINTLPGEVETVFYEGDEIIILYPYADGVGYSVTEKDDKISVNGKENIFIWFFDVPKTTIKIPHGTILDISADVDAAKFILADGDYKTVELDLDAGVIFIGNITCSTLKIELDAGELNCGDITCTTISCDLDAGEINLGNVFCSNANFEVDAGSLNAQNMDCINVDIEVNAGDLNIDKATASQVKIKVNAGEVNIKMTGSIEEYTILKEVSAGSFNLSAQMGTTEKTIKVDVNAGEVNINFPIEKDETLNGFDD